MRLDFRTLIMVTFLISIYSAGNYYLFHRLNAGLSLGLDWTFCAMGALLGCCAFIFLIWHPLPIKTVYHMAACWFGFTILCFVTFLAAEMIYLLLPGVDRYLVIASLLTALCVSAYAVSRNLSGRKSIFVELISSKIVDPARIVLIADTHISGFHSGAYLSRIVEEVNRHDPDIVCIGGDFADGQTRYSAIAPLNEIQAPVYLVMGNHEVWNNHDGKVEELLKKTKVEILRTSINNGIHLIGVHYGNGHKGLTDALKSIVIGDDLYNVLLYHEPHGVEAAQEAGIDLMLSGHTHGGQMFPWNYVTRTAYKYLKGLYQYEGMQIYVSQGTGVWGPPMRLGSTNEITVIDLKPEQIHH